MRQQAQLVLVDSQAAMVAVARDSERKALISLCLHKRSEAGKAHNTPRHQ